MITSAEALPRAHCPAVIELFWEYFGVTGVKLACKRRMWCFWVLSACLPTFVFAVGVEAASTSEYFNGIKESSEGVTVAIFAVVAVLSRIITVIASALLYKEFGCTSRCRGVLLDWRMSTHSLPHSLSVTATVLSLVVKLIPPPFRRCPVAVFAAEVYDRLIVIINDRSKKFFTKGRRVSDDSTPSKPAKRKGKSVQGGGNGELELDWDRDVSPGPSRSLVARTTPNSTNVNNPLVNIPPGDVSSARAPYSPADEVPVWCCFRLLMAPVA